MSTFMKSRQWVIALGLLTLVLAAIVGSFLTRDEGTTVAVNKSRESTEEVTLVDERPLQTARAMAKLATSPDEQRVANEAVELADDQVDLAFHDASRDAADHPAISKPENRELFQHASEAEEQVKVDQDLVNKLKKQVASAGPGTEDKLQGQLDVAQAQLELDQDELGDAKEDLIRSGADPGSLIQRQFAQHQAVEHGSDAKTVFTNTTEVNYGAGSLLAQIKAWRELRDKVKKLQQARTEAGAKAATLNQAHLALDKQVVAEKAHRHSAGTAVTKAPGESGPSTNASGSGDDASNAIKSLHVLSDSQKNLADLDKRVQDEQDLGNTYASWITLVQSHQRSALHGMIQSALLILLVILMVYLAGNVIDHYLLDKAQEFTRLHTLRAVIRFVLQAVGLVLILLVILGAPQQTPTILGLAGAGLTVAMKDFIVAFFGWFVLMGANGIRVGDWVEINGVAGEVVEINLLRTVLLETGNWNEAGHPTGRKVAFVNSYAIEGHFFNFTTSGQWLWDELQVTVPAQLDPYAMLEEIQAVVSKETEAEAHTAEEEWGRVTSRYRVRAVAAVPAVTLRPTATGTEIHVRYITRARERSAMRGQLNQALVQLLRSKGAGDKESLAAAK
jgi:small-conductance mechanosensitive channel